MKDAGLPHKKADEGVSDDDKRTLLAHLKRSHGSEEAAPRKITLKRKSVSTLKTGGSSGKRTVNVEVRKKRTYVKRPEAEEVAEPEVPEWRLRRRRSGAGGFCDPLQRRIRRKWPLKRRYGRQRSC